jgi:hypothetical protein
MAMGSSAIALRALPEAIAICMALKLIKRSLVSILAFIKVRSLVFVSLFKLRSLYGEELQLIDRY